METRSERVTIPVSGAAMGGYLARLADDGPHPGILVFMQIFGVNRHIRTVADRIARLGYVALAPDYFHRTAPGVEYGYDEAACETPVRAAASFYGGAIAAEHGFGGGPSTLSRTPKIRGRVLCLFGGRDAMIPPASIEAIRAALERDGVRHEIVVYPDAGHGFCCDERGSYHEPSAADAWRRVERLFDAELRKGG